MDLASCTNFMRLKLREHYIKTNAQLYEAINVKEFVELEEMKTEIFKKRLEYFVMAHCLKEKIAIELEISQFKKYFRVHLGLSEERSTSLAKKYNTAVRTYKKFDVIFDNVEKCPKIDIRDLNLDEIPRCTSSSYVRRRAALLRGSKRKSNTPCPYDKADVSLTIQAIKRSKWFSDSKKNPGLVAHIMDVVSDSIVTSAIFESQR